jgi:hypothetical protein
MDPREIPEGELAYVVVHQGDLVHASPDIDSALAAAEQAASSVGGGYVLDAAPAEPERAELAVAANPPKTAMQALAAAGLQRLNKRDVMAYDLEEALAEWSYLMPTHRVVKGEQVEITGWKLPDVASGWTRRGGGLLRTNFKMEKKKGRGAMAYVLGLSLIPAQAVSRGYLGEDKRRRLPLAASVKRGVNLCTWSTKECRSTCLVFSGQNTNTPYHVAVKQGATLALLKHPEAFVRVLVEAAHNHLNCHGRFFPYVRLNVLSDIPWEAFTPWLFPMFPGKRYRRGGMHAFYDYTKIPGRRTPDNYDVTYSYSSTAPKRHGLAMRELEGGRRVAVVFLLPGESKVKRRKAAFPKRWEIEPGRFVKVIDGDEHDVRPRDPGGVVVGLRYKHPGKMKEAEMQANRRAGKLGDFVVQINPHEPETFVTRVRQIGGMLVADQSPKHTGVIPLLGGAVL